MPWTVFLPRVKLMTFEFNKRCHFFGIYRADFRFASSQCETSLQKTSTELILGLRPANEGRRYRVTPSLIGWAQT